MEKRIFMKRSISRWIPAIVAPVLVASVAVGSSVASSAEVVLPDKTPSQILQFINTNPNVAFSGKITKVANLGLPAVNLLPNISQASVDQMKKTLPKGMADFIPKASVQGNLAIVLGLLAGTQQANVYYNNPSLARVQLLDQMSERDFVANGKDLWFYDATQQTVIHQSVDKADLVKDQSRLLSLFNENASKLPFDALSPASVADYFLQQISPSTTVSAGKNVLVAGRGAYELTLTPKSTGTLVSSVSILVDGINGVPLSVSINAVGQSNPAFKVSFDSVSFGASAPSIFAFAPPVGATVQELAVPGSEGQMNKQMQTPSAADKAAALAEFEKVKSEGWSAVTEIPASQIPSKELALIKSNSFFNVLTKPVNGGRIFSTTLFNILFTDDGRIFAGAVTKEKLLEAAAR
jgi:outer membrane lipoprotein-sorting protein